MDNNQPAENRWNQIDRYVNGEMPEPERDSFEQRMREHAGLAQQVHLHRDILAGMEYHFAQQLKEQLALSDRPQKKFNIAQVWWIAATMLLVAGAAGAAYYYLSRPADAPALAVAYFEPYPNTLTQVNRSDTSNAAEASSGEQAVRATMEAYEAGRYPQAAAGFGELLAIDSLAGRRMAYTFYRGVAYLAADQPSEATRDFLTVMQQPDSRLTEPARWYLGLSYLSQGQTAEARQIFTELRRAGGNYAEEASQLLDELG